MDKNKVIPEAETGTIRQRKRLERNRRARMIESRLKGGEGLNGTTEEVDLLDTK